jgi:SAM-dependent methyltransferase
MTPDPRHVWRAGSYAVVGDLFAAAGADLVGLVDVEGHDVLDVACGTGNTALAAARAGATHVTGVDLTPELLAEAARRAEAAGLADRVTWRESDMATLPVPDAAFDRVTSTFGAMFATDQRRVAGELLRACRPGGTVGVTAWTHDGLFDAMSTLFAGFLPEPPPPGPGPRDWADPDLLAAVFGVAPADLVVRERAVEWVAPSAEAAVDLLAEASGPVVMLRTALGDRWPAARDACVELFAARGRPGDGGTLLLDLAYTATTLVRA